MPVSRKMAQWMSKQIKEVPKDDPDLKELAKQEMAALEMVNMSKKELEELSKGRGRKAEAASDEIARRIAKKEIKQGKDVDPDLAGTPSSSEYRKFREGVYNKGGMVKKKPAAKKAATAKKKPAVKNTYNKFYGK
jgi:hypothetical protein